MSSNIRLTAQVKAKLKEFMNKEGINTLSDAVKILLEKIEKLEGLENIIEGIDVKLDKIERDSIEKK